MEVQIERKMEMLRCMGDVAYKYLSARNSNDVKVLKESTSISNMNNKPQV